MTKLNPCPLCGSEPDLTVFSDCISTVVCECGLAVDVGATTGDAAINGWNDVTSNFTQPTKTLRDEFAMAAFTGFASSDTHAEWSTEYIAKKAYEAADHMLKERSK